uniref:Uncharacterized protein n=1 Tax=Anguilla anguilla TaxID=7936 RepID=A0A0E9WU08_ANGAN
MEDRCSGLSHCNQRAQNRLVFHAIYKRKRAADSVPNSCMHLWSHRCMHACVRAEHHRTHGSRHKENTDQS